MSMAKAAKSSNPDSIGRRTSERTVDLDDPKFLKRLRAGDPTAYELLVRRLHPTLVRFAASITGNMAHAEEAVQDSWIAFHAGIIRFESRCRLTTWIWTIVKNRACTRARREGQYVRMSTLMAPFTDGIMLARSGDGDQANRNVEAAALCDRLDPERVASGRQSWRTVRHLMERLPDRQRDVLGMRALDGLDAAEVQTRLGISAENERVLLHRARRCLRAGCPDGLRAGLA